MANNNIAFKTQIASIMEVLANAAVAEICKLIDDDYAVLRLEISHSQNENRTLKRKLQMMELKMARERAERTIRERAPSARSGGRTSVMERNRGWRGGGLFPTRDRFLATQGESSWRNRRCFTDDQPSKRTSETPTVIELEDPEVQIKQEIPEAVLHGPEGTSWKRIVGPVCDGMVSHTVTADPLASSAEQPGSRQTVVEAMKTDLDQPLTEMGEHEERRIEASTSFSLAGFKESELTINSAMFPSSCIEEHNVLPPMEHSSFSRVVKMESEEANSRPSTSVDQWSGTVGVEWNACLASERTDDRGSTSDTLEVSGSDSTHRLQTERLSCAINELRADKMTWEMRTSGVQWEINSEGQPESLAPQLVSILRPSDGYSLPSLGSEKCETDVLVKRTSDHGQVAPVLPQVNKDEFLAEMASVGSFVSPRKDTRKAKRKNAAKKLFPCLLCGRTFKCPKQVEIHHRVHTGEKPFRCSLCPASFSVAGNLKRHQRVHTGEKPFSCPQCNRRFSLRHQLQKHLRCHSGEKPFSCFRCGKRFAEKSYVRLHLQRSHSVSIN
ncbi:zinc finger protein with KRAB and SCAN domains 1-like isoform X2 [Alosa sapidissima]|uniref:zinc finger protein with KRAB and SCAN domains 1-like isoform X2 n=1 Tax=Alosa sapidissima TaxID=34773 RepID=UPI001C084C8A|nr:zinc finger protein with KRAB and SCAN domains 1-like isoform X2 [Alosa sapidissima]